MPITYPLQMPTLPGFVSFKWEPDAMVVEQPNEFSYASQIFAWEGQRRKASVTVGEMVTRAEAKAWQAFILKLNGVEGTFLMQDPLDSHHTGLYNLSGLFTPTVKGDGQNGPDLLTENWAPSMVGAVKLGDYISIGYRLYQVLADASSNASGVATLLIWPHARLNLTDGMVISVGEQAWGRFRLTEFPAFTYDVEKLMTGFSFACKEAF